MIRKTISVLAFCTLTAVVTLNAEPPAKSKSRRQSKKPATTVAITPAQALPEGWSLIDGVWTHSDGYKLVHGEVIRTGTQAHKRPPKPPTRAQMAAATQKKKTVPTAAEIAAAKAAERERNLRPRPAPQTGTHL